MDEKEEILHNLEILKQELKVKTGPQNMGAPEIVFIEHDDYHAQDIGHAANGLQFFFPPIFSNVEFVVLFLFNQSGDLVESKIEDLGPRDSYDKEHARAVKAEWLSQLEPLEYGDIQVKPFAVEHNGTMMGLIPTKYPDCWVVEVLPGNVMAFSEPWDSGVYET
jgi:hypothetical protein